jgi:uncharacterized protein
MPFWRFGRSRAEAAALEQEVTALQAALARCKSVTRWSGMRRAWMVLGAVLIFAAGFWLGVNREPLQQSVADITGSVGLGRSVRPIDAAYAAYQKGDHAAALRRARPLAEEGDARAQSLLGLMYDSGRGVPRDDAEAGKWLRLAADQGDAVAQFRLGIIYSEGRSVPQDHGEAAHWYRLAADQGHAQAQYNLGVLYTTGEGVPQDNVSAHVWFNIAVATFPTSDTRNRGAAVQSRDLVATKLTREQVAEAQRLAREWRPVRRTRQADGSAS